MLVSQVAISAGKSWQIAATDRFIAVLGGLICRVAVKEGTPLVRVEKHIPQCPCLSVLLTLVALVAGCEDEDER